MIIYIYDNKYIYMIIYKYTNIYDDDKYIDIWHYIYIYMITFIWEYIYIYMIIYIIYR